MDNDDEDSELENNMKAIQWYGLDRTSSSYHMIMIVMMTMTMMMISSIISISILSQYAIYDDD
jgi:hypothetical protein